MVDVTVQMSDSEQLTSAELVNRAAAIVPALRRNGRQTDDDRKVADENIELLRDAGILRMFRPRRYGGIESDIRAKTVVMSEVARGCPSTAWVSTIYVDLNWLVGFFPDEAQDEVFADPDVLITATLRPGGQATKTDSGYAVTGTWQFNSGCLHADWCAQPAMMQGPDGTPSPALFLLPYSDLVIEDDWHTYGLRGTGSNTVRAEDVIVPEHRVLPLGPAMHGQHLSVLNTEPIYRVSPPHFINTSMAPTALGTARAAHELFMDRVHNRGITYTSYERQSDAAITHFQVAQSALKIKAAESAVYQVADTIDTHAVSGEALTTEERAWVRGTTGFAIGLCTEAVETLRSGSGARSIMLDVPIQRFARDMQALNVHAMGHPNSGLEVLGRVLCGLEPETMWF